MMIMNNACFRFDTERFGFLPERIEVIHGLIRV